MSGDDGYRLAHNERETAETWIVEEWHHAGLEDGVKTYRWKPVPGLSFWTEDEAEAIVQARKDTGNTGFRARQYGRLAE